MRPTIQRLRSINSSIIHVISFSLHLFFFFKILSKRSIKLSPQQNWYNHVTLIGFSFWIALSLAFLKFQTSTCSRTSTTTLHFNLSLTNEQLNLKFSISNNYGKLKIGEKSTIFSAYRSLKRNLVSLWQRIVKKLPSWRKLSIDQRSGTRAFNRLRSTTLEQICKLPHRSIQGWSLNEERSLVWNPTLLDRQFIFKYVRI